MKQVDLIIYDFDGVVVDSEFLYKKANKIALERSLIHISDEELNEKFWGLDYPSIIALLQKEFGKMRTQVFHETIQPLAMELFEKELETIPNIVEFIEASPYQYCIGSNSRTFMIEEKLKMLKIDDLFKDRFFGADLVDKPKPDPALFKHCADQFGVPYEHCLVIEDGIHGIHAANQLGMTSIGFTGASHTISDHEDKLFDAGAVSVIEDILQLHSIIESFGR